MLLGNDFFAKQISPDHPNIILNGISSRYICTDDATNDDIYSNIYGEYRISETPEGKIVKADYCNIFKYRYLLKEWKLEDEGKLPIIYHRPSTYVGKEPYLDYEIYQNDLGLFYVYDTPSGKRVQIKSLIREFGLLPYGAYHPHDWYLDLDYTVDDD